MVAGRERWKPIVGFEFRYEVSSLGRVRRVCTSHGTNAGRILTGGIGGGVHRKVDLFRNGTRRSVLVYQLVAAAFLGARPAKARIRFRDGNPANVTARNVVYTRRSP